MRLIAIKAIWTWQGSGVVYNKSFFIVWPSWRNVSSTLKLLREECRADVITSSQALLSQRKT